MAISIIIKEISVKFPTCFTGILYLNTLLKKPGFFLPNDLIPGFG
jgi:hypothetical protein